MPEKRRKDRLTETGKQIGRDRELQEDENPVVFYIFL